ncbi:hypothetical protein GCM10009574_016740 [Streptomyces asiaticus]
MSGRWSASKGIRPSCERSAPGFATRLLFRGLRPRAPAGAPPRTPLLKRRRGWEAGRSAPLRRCWPEGAQSPLSNAGGAGKWGDPPPRATVALSAAQPLPAPLPKCRRGWEAGRSAPLRRR